MSSRRNQPVYSYDLLCPKPKRSLPRKRAPSLASPSLPRRVNRRQKRSLKMSPEPWAEVPASNFSFAESVDSLSSTDSQLFSLANEAHIASTVGQVLGPCPADSGELVCTCTRPNQCDQVFCKAMLDIKRRACNIFTMSQRQSLAAIMDVGLTLTFVVVVVLVIRLLFFTKKSC